MFCLLTEFYDHINDKKRHCKHYLACFKAAALLAKHGENEHRATDGLHTLMLLHISKEPYLLGLLCTFQTFLMTFNN